MLAEKKSWPKNKIRHIGGFKFGGFTIVHQPHPFIYLLTLARMEKGSGRGEICSRKTLYS